MARALIVERDDATRKLITEHFNGSLFVEMAAGVESALKAHGQDRFDLIIWNTLSIPDKCANVIKVVKKFLKRSAATRVIVISETSEPEIISLRDLPCEWLRQPINEDEFLALVETAIRRRFDVAENEEALGTPNPDVPIEFEGILAVPFSMRSVIHQIIEVAAADIPVLISGETGTGKDLVAAAIHKRSKRSNFPFLPVNMGAIATALVASELFGHEKGAFTGASEARSGLFEQAQGGTVFLDEITTMDEKTQVSLLRVLETNVVRRVGGEKDIPVDVRVSAATNDNIEEAVAAGRFREDLYYRLDVFRIQLPPLRERHGAVALLTDHFVARFAAAYKKEIHKVSAETYRLLRRYCWPGNLRELKNVIQRAVLLTKTTELTPDLLPQRIREANGPDPLRPYEQSPIQLGMPLLDVEKEYIKMTLAAINGNKKKAASLLRISRRALYNKLRRFGMF